jgi:hypothetical protein
MPTPPLTWSIDAAAVHSAENFVFEANARELEALTRYAEVEEVASFKACVKVAPLAGERFKATGVLEASAIQASVVNLEAVPTAVEEHFSVEFRPEDSIGGQETAPSFEENAPEPILGGRILIGEFLCELFSVSLDPYPRNPNDAFEWNRQEGEPPASPFAELAQFRRKKPDEA